MTHSKNRTGGVNFNDALANALLLTLALLAAIPSVVALLHMAVKLA